MVTQRMEMDESAIMTTGVKDITGSVKTKKRGLQTLKAVSFVPSKRRRKLHFEFDDSSMSSADDVSPDIVPRSLSFLLYLAGSRNAIGSSSAPRHIAFHHVPSSYSRSSTKMEPTLNLDDLVQQFYFQVNTNIQVVANNAGSGSMNSRQIIQLPINGVTASTTSNTQLCHEAYCGLLLWIQMDGTIQEEIIPSNNLTSWLLQYLNHPDGNVSCFVLDMLRYLAGSSNHLRQRMGSNVELIRGILCILKENTIDRCKQQLGLSILSWVVEVESCRELLIKEGFVEHLFGVMDIYPWNDVVQCNATATLCWLLHSSPISSSTSPTLVSEQDPALARLEPSSSVMILLNTMRRFLMDAKVLGNTMSALSGILLKHALGLESHQYPSVDIVRLTLLGMRCHRVDRPKVQSNGLTLLRILLARDNGYEEGAVEGDSVIGAVVRNMDIIHESMKQYSDDSFIQAEACGILAYLVSSSSSSSSSRSSNTSTTTDGRSRILQSGCIETVVQAQMKHRGDIRLQHYALWFHSGLLRDLSSPGAIAFGAGLSVLDTMAAGRIVPLATAED